VSRHSIVLLPGDGVGPEVARAARTALEAVAAKFGHDFAFAEHLIGGIAIDETGEPLPDATLTACLKADAVFLGAVGGPKWDLAPKRPEQGLLAIRKSMGLFANLRPATVDEALIDRSPLKADAVRGVDILIVRELTGGIYFGERTRTATWASDLCTYSVEEIERVAKIAFEAARGRRGKLTSVDKANVLETSRLWRETVVRLHKEHYPDVTLDHGLVDSAAMKLITGPRDYDVILTENMFGDILSDEASVLAGSIGLLGSASLGADGPGLFEPIHGSAPDIAGQDKANPIGAIRSAAMLLRYGLGLAKEADAVEAAVSAAINAGELTGDLGGKLGTQGVAAKIAAGIAARL
jgi:3-isopropylmalate dehydrogenase